MSRQPFVLLLGDSVLVDGVAVSLGGSQVLGVARINTLTSNIDECLESLRPDLVVFELDSPYSPLVFSLLRERPGLRLVGLDLACSRVIVLNSRQHTTCTMSELVHVVQVQIDDATRS